MRKEERQTGDGSRKRLERKHHGSSYLQHSQNMFKPQAFKMTTHKTSTCQDSSNLKMQTGKQGKQNTSVPHFSQPNSTQATIALVVSNCKNAKLPKQANTQYMLNNQVPLKQLLLWVHSTANMKHSKTFSAHRKLSSSLVSWPRSSLHRGRIPVLERKRLRASISPP